MDITGLSSAIQTKQEREVELAHLAEIVRTPLFKTETTKNAHPFYVVSIKDFPDAGYLATPAKRIYLDHNASRAERFTLRPHDFLVTIVGTVGRVTIVPDGCGCNWIPATNMLRLRFSVRAKEQAIALYAFFKSPLGNATLNALVHGTSIPLVAKRPFSAIRVPVLNEFVEREAAELWAREQDLYDESLRTLEAAKRVFDSFLSG